MSEHRAPPTRPSWMVAPPGAPEEELLDHSRAAHIRRPGMDYTGMD